MPVLPTVLDSRSFLTDLYRLKEYTGL